MGQNPFLLHRVPPVLCVPVQRLRHVDKAFALSVIFHVKAEVEVVYFDVS